MESHRSPSCNLQVARQHSIDNGYRNLHSLPLIISPRPQQSDDSDLFAALLFDRQSAYRTTQLSQSWTRELTSTEQRFLQSNADTPPAPPLLYTSSGDEKTTPCNTPAYIFQSRAMPPKKAAASEKKKPVAKTTLDKTRGRTIAPQKLVKAVGVAVVRKETTKTTVTKARCKQKPNESSRKGISKTTSKAAIPEDEDITMISSGDDTETEEETKEAQSARQLRAELAAAKATIQQLKAQAEKAQRDLLAEQEKTRALQTEKDELISQVATTKAEQKDLTKEMLATEEERRTLKSQIQHLTTQNTNLTTRTKHLATEKEDVASTNLQLRTENILLRDETQRLKAYSSASTAAPPPPPLQSTSTSTLLPASPAPSSIAFTDEDIKLDNVRKVYVQLKRKQDSLKGIVRQLMWCTRNMVLDEFGEFGVVVRRLREWMEEEDEQQKQATKKQKQKQRVGTGG